MTTTLCPLTFDDATHAYRLNGIPVPSVTQVLRASGYVSFYQDLTDQIADGTRSPADGVLALVSRGRRLAEARDRGQRVHTALHLLLEGDLDDDSIDDEVRGYLESGKTYLEAHVRQVYRAEMPVWSIRHGYAGTLDLLALHSDGWLFVGDFKSGEPDVVAADLQLAAYLGALLEMGTADAALGVELRAHGPLVRRRSIRLFKDGRIARESLYSDPRDFQKFLGALALVHDQGRRPNPITGWDDER